MKAMPSPFATRNTSNVETKHGQRADHHDARGHIDPVTHMWGEDDRRGSRTKVEGELERDARHHDMGGPADRENDAFQRASSRWARPPASSDSRHGVLSSTAGSADALDGR